jgi:hypothetical protein
MKKLALVAVCAIFAGCVTLSGTYNVVARDPATGADLPGPNFMAQGSGIYSVRNALCSRNPGALIVITDTQTGQELKSESPYKCK